jgi:hypothetical protein
VRGAVLPEEGSGLKSIADHGIGTGDGVVVDADDLSASVDGVADTFITAIQSAQIEDVSAFP